jgi:hypothetical protein
MCDALVCIWIMHGCKPANVSFSCYRFPIVIDSFPIENVPFPISRNTGFVFPSNILVPVSDSGKKYSNGNGLSIFPTVPDRFQAYSHLAALLPFSLLPRFSLPKPTEPSVHAQACPEPRHRPPGALPRVTRPAEPPGGPPRTRPRSATPGAEQCPRLEPPKDARPCAHRRPTPRPTELRSRPATPAPSPSVRVNGASTRSFLRVIGAVSPPHLLGAFGFRRSSKT